MLRKNRDYAGILAATALSLVLMGLPQGHKELVADWCRGAFWASGQWLFTSVIEYGRNNEKAQYLLQENVDLALENMRLQEAKEENERLRRALQFRERNQTHHLIPAQVIGRDPDQIFDTLTIDVGNEQGVRLDWPVVTTEGLVGHIIQIDEQSSVVQLIMRSRVSAVMQSGRAQGMVWWDSGNQFRLRYVDASTEIAKGDLVVSSGLGGRYPKGITIGVVTHLRDQKRDPLFKEVLLESNVEFLNIEEAFIMVPEDGGSPGLHGEKAPVAETGKR